MYSQCHVHVTEDINKVIVETILDKCYECSDHVQMIAASIIIVVDCVRAMGSPLSSTKSPNHAMNDGITAKEVAMIG